MTEKNPTEVERYCLVWQNCADSRHNDIAARFFVPGFKGHLPFFLSGDEVELAEAGMPVELTERHLLFGVLYGLDEFDNRPNPWHDPEHRHTLTYLLDVLGNGFGFTDPEQLLLDVAAKARSTNGSVPSRTMLRTALKLMPFSSKIRSDLVCDSWVVACESDSPEEVLTEIVELVEETNLDGIDPQAKEVICYYGFCAKIFLGDWDNIEHFLENYVYPNVNLRQLKIRVKDLLEHPSEFTIEEMKLT